MAPGAKACENFPTRINMAPIQACVQEDRESATAYLGRVEDTCALHSGHEKLAD